MEMINEILKKVQATAPSPEPLCTLKPARFKAFVRIMRQVVKLNGPRPIYLANSRLSQPIGHSNFWVDIDLSNLLEVACDKSQAAAPGVDVAQRLGVSFAFLATDSEFQELAAMAGGESDIAVWDRGDKVAFANIRTDPALQKPARCLSFLRWWLPTDDQRVGEELTVSDLAGLKSYVGTSRYVTLLVYNGQLEQVKVPNRSRPYTLHASSGPYLTGRKPNLALTSQNFLDLAGKLDLTVGLYLNDLGFWLKTSSRKSMTNNVTTFECLYAGPV